MSENNNENKDSKKIYSTDEIMSDDYTPEEKERKPMML